MPIGQFKTILLGVLWSLLSGNTVAVEVNCAQNLKTPREELPIDQLSPLGSLNCTLKNRTEKTPGFCQCISKRDEIIRPKIQATSEQVEKFNSALLQTHGRIVKQSISRIIMSIAQLEAEAQLFSYHPKGLVANTCSLDNIKGHLEKFTSKGCRGKSGKEITNKLSIALGFDLNKPAKENIGDFISNFKTKAKSAISSEIDPGAENDNENCLPKQFYYQYQRAGDAGATKGILKRLHHIKSTLGESLFLKAKANDQGDALTSIIATALKEIENAGISPQEKSKIKEEIEELSKMFKAIFTYNTAPEVEKFYLNTRTVDDTLRLLTNMDQLNGGNKYTEESFKNGSYDIDALTLKQNSSQESIKKLSGSLKENCHRVFDEAIEELACDDNHSASEENYKDVLDNINNREYNNGSWKNVKRSEGDFSYDSLYCSRVVTSGPKLDSLLLNHGEYEYKLLNDKKLIFQENKVIQFNKLMCPVLRSCEKDKCKILNPQDILNDSSKLQTLNQEQINILKTLIERGNEINDLKRKIPQEPGAKKSKISRSITGLFGLSLDSEPLELSKVLLGDVAPRVNDNEKINAESPKEQYSEKLASSSAGSEQNNEIQPNANISVPQEISSSFNTMEAYAPNNNYSIPRKAYNQNNPATAVEDYEQTTKKSLNTSTNNNTGHANSSKSEDITPDEAQEIPTREIHKKESQTIKASNKHGEKVESNSGSRDKEEVVPENKSSSLATGSENRPNPIVQESSKASSSARMRIGDEVFSQAKKDKLTISGMDALNDIEKLNSPSTLNKVEEWFKEKKVDAEIIFMDLGIPELKNEKIKMRAIVKDGKLIELIPLNEDENLTLLDKLTNLLESTNKISSSSRKKIHKLMTDLLNRMT